MPESIDLNLTGTGICCTFLIEVFNNNSVVMTDLFDMEELSMANRVKSHLDLLSVWFPVFSIVWLAALVVIASVQEWYWLIGAVAFGLIVIAVAIQSVPLVHEGLVIRLGRRVVLEEREEDAYYFLENGRRGKRLTKQEVAGRLAELDNVAKYQKEAEILRRYLVKGEGLRIVLPLVEKLIFFPVGTQTEEKFKATDVYTRDNIPIIPVLFATWRIIDTARAVELEDETGKMGEETVRKFVRSAIEVAVRSVFSSCDLPDSLRKYKPKYEGEPAERARSGDIGQLLKEDISDAVSAWGVTLLTIGVRDIEPTESPDSREAFQALANVTKERLKREKEIIDADRELEVRTRKAQAGLVESQRQADGIKALADAALHREQKEAVALRTKISAFRGKGPEARLTPEESEAYAQFQVNLQRAGSLKDNTKVIVIPSDGISPIASGLAAAIAETLASIKTVKES